MRARGFTLLELLVAMAIFSVLGLGSYQLLRSVSESHDRVRGSINSYIRVSQALSIIQRDFNQYVPRQVRDRYGDPMLPMTFEVEDYLVEFTRGGWANPGARPRSELQRVAYSLDFEEEKLKRHFWLVLDRAEDSEPITQVLLEGVTDFRVTAFTGGQQTNPQVQAVVQAGNSAPLAVEVVLATEELGEVQRLFQLVEPYLAPASGAGPGGGGGQNDPEQPGQTPTITPGTSGGDQ